MRDAYAFSAFKRKENERLPGILSGRAVIIGLETALPVISHSVAFLRSIFLHCLLKYAVENGSFGGLGILMPGTVFLSFRFPYAGYHLNRIHFEISLKSVCCVNPSLDAYFNSAVTIILIYCIGRNSRKNYPFLK